MISSHHPRLLYIANVGFYRTYPLPSIDTPLNLTVYRPVYDRLPCLIPRFLRRPRTN